MCRKTVSTMRCAAHRCMLRTSEPKVTAVSSVWTVGHADAGRRPVEEHQEDAGDGEQDEQEEGETAEAQRVRHLHRVPLHLHRVKVVQHVVHDHVGAVAGAVGVARGGTPSRAGRSRSTPASRGPSRRPSRAPGRPSRRRRCCRCSPLPLATNLSPRNCWWRSEPHAVRVAVTVRCGRGGRPRRCRAGACRG